MALERGVVGGELQGLGPGNLRYLLPEGHGISIFETEGMAFGNTAEYRKVAERILHDTILNPKPVREACSRGADFIARTYNRAAMRRDLADRLAELEEIPAETDLDRTRVGLSPLVRSWNPETRRIVSDYRSLELTPDQAALLGEMIDQPLADLACRRDRSLQERADNLFRQGVVALYPLFAAG